MFNFTRKSTSGKGTPTWLKAGPVYLKDHTRRSKNDPPVISATFLHANPEYAHVRLPSGTETTVSMRDIAQHPTTIDDYSEVPTTNSNNPDQSVQASNSNNINQSDRETISENIDTTVTEEANTDSSSTSEVEQPSPQSNNLTVTPIRRSVRVSRLPPRFKDFKMD